jgi:RNA polymerase-binding transcription factor DksA
LSPKKNTTKKSTRAAKPVKRASKTAAKSTSKKSAPAKAVKKKAQSLTKKAPAKAARTTKKAPAKKAIQASKKPSIKQTAVRKATAKKAPAKKTTARATAVKSVAKLSSASKSTNHAKPKRAKSGDDYTKFRDFLLSLRSRLIGDVQMMSQEALGGSDGAADNHAPIHPAEVGSHSFEQEFTLNLLSSDGDRLEQIEAALEKIADGTYGSCEECGGRIPKARLELIPDVPYCVKCASKLER